MSLLPIMKTSLPLILVTLLSCISAAAGKPNIVLMMIDDLGAEAIGCYGGQSYPTPHIDALADRGMKFENAFSMPACMVSRATLLTGRYGFRSNLPFNDTPWVRENSWGKGEITFANLLKDAGYATGISGKWQLCEHDRYPNHLDDLGFTHQNSWAWWKDGETKRRYWGPGFYRDKKFVDEAATIYGPDRFCDWTIEFMREQVAAEKPFLAYYPMVLIHHPWPQTPDNKDTPQPGWTEADNLREHPKQKFSQPNFNAMVAYTDKMVGRITAAIDELGIAENTLFILTSDNGTIAKIISQYQGHPVQGGKMRLNEAGSRVPLIAVWKGKITAGSMNNSLIDFSDFAPTLADLAGTAMPADRVIDGMSFLPQLLGQANAPQRDWVFSRYRDRSFVRGKKYRLSNNGALHDMSQDRYAPTLIDQPNAEAAQSRKQLRAVYQSLKHPVGPKAGRPPRLILSTESSE